MLRRDAAALHAFIDDRQSIPHNWGRQANDCVGYAIGAVEAQTGIVVAWDVDWAGPLEARKVIARFGSIEAAFDAYFDRVPCALARRGDIAGVPDAEFGLHPMVVEGVTLVGPGDNGNRRLPRSAMTIAWSATSLRP